MNQTKIQVGQRYFGHSTKGVIEIVSLDDTHAICKKPEHSEDGEYRFKISDIIYWAIGSDDDETRARLAGHTWKLKRKV